MGNFSKTSLCSQRVPMVAWSIIIPSTDLASNLKSKLSLSLNVYLACRCLFHYHVTTSVVYHNGCKIEHSILIALWALICPLRKQACVNIYMLYISVLLTAILVALSLRYIPVFFQLFCLVLKVVYIGHILWGLLKAGNSLTYTFLTSWIIWKLSTCFITDEQWGKTSKS